MIRELAVRRIKPLVPAGVWQTLRRLDPKNRPPPVTGAAPGLTELAVKHGTDKWGRHRYTPHYEFHLSHLRDESFTLLEIGIGGYRRRGAGGASLRMWKEYFGHAQIVGLDIEDKSFVDEDRIRTYRGSQVDTALLRDIVRDAENLRVVIDDGSHRNEHVLKTFADLFPMLPDDVIYIIEDTETSYREEFGGSRDLAATGTTMNMVKGLLDGLNHVEYAGPGYQPSYTERHVVGVHAYHNLVVIEKGLNDEERSRGPFTPEELAAVATDHDGGVG
jgi:hypothetical protein